LASINLSCLFSIACTIFFGLIVHFFLTISFSFLKWKPKDFHIKDPIFFNRI